VLLAIKGSEELDNCNVRIDVWRNIGISYLKKIPLIR